MKSRLVSMTQMLNDAKKGHYAVAQININNLEWIKAVLEAVKEANTPIILGVSGGAAKYMGGFKNVVDMVNNLLEFYDVKQPVALHLDHGSYEHAMACIEAGFSSIMFDGSALPFEENMKKLAEVLAICKKKGISVEAEVGAIGGNEDGHEAEGELADVNECAKIAKTGIDCLAAGIGNIHGLYPANWKGLSLDRLEEISVATNRIPLVLHGGTGIPEDQIKKAISLGVCKINVNTECQVAFSTAVRKYIEDKKDLDKGAKGFDPRKVLKEPANAIKKTVIEKVTLFGSKNKA